MSIAAADEAVSNSGALLSAGATTVTDSHTFSSGDVILVWGTCIGQSSATVADSVNSGGYTMLTPIATAGAIYTFFGYKEANASGTATITLTLPGNGTWRGLKSLRLTGAAASGFITAARQAQTGVGTGADGVSSGNLTAGTDALLLAGCTMNDNNGATPSFGTSFSDFAGTTHFLGDSQASRWETRRIGTPASGNYPVTYTSNTGSSVWATQALMWKETAAAGGTPKNVMFFGGGV